MMETLKKLIFKHKFWFLVGILFLSISLIDTQAVSASSRYTTPKSLRGTWYEYNRYSKKNGFFVIKIMAHKVISYGDGMKNSYTPYRHGSYRLNVQYHPKGWYGIGGATYTFNNGIDTAHQLPQFWIGKRKIHGHYRHVLKGYLQMGWFQVYLKTKVHHDYSYNYDKSDYMSKIGR